MRLYPLCNRFPSALAVLLTVALSLALLQPASVHAQPMGQGPLKPALAEVDSLRSAGAYKEALAQLSSLRREYPNDEQVLWRLSVTNVDIGEQSDSQTLREQVYQQALEVANEAVAADSQSAYAHLAKAIAEGRVALLASTRERIERSRAVKEHADRAIALDSTLAPAYHVLGRWNYEVESLGFLKRAVVRTVYGGLPEASYEQSVEHFEKAIRYEDKIIHHLELGRTYIAMDEEEKAREQLQAVLDMPVKDPDDPQHKKEAERLLNEVG